MCRFNKGDINEKYDKYNNKVTKHYVYVYVECLGNCKLIAKSVMAISENVGLEKIA